LGGDNFLPASIPPCKGRRADLEKRNLGLEKRGVLKGFSRAAQLKFFFLDLWIKLGRTRVKV